MEIESILNHEILEKIGKEKTLFLLEMQKKVRSASTKKEMIKIFAEISNLSKQSDIQFTPEEFKIICAILKQNGSEEERNKIEKCLKTFAEQKEK